MRKYLDEFQTGRYVCSMDASGLDVLVSDGRLMFTPGAAEARLLELLAGGPMPALEAARLMGLSSPLFLPLERLEDSGAIKRGALTPTDLLHVTGEFQRWDTDASKRALAIFAAMLGRSPEETLELARDAVTRRIFEAVVNRQVSWEQGGGEGLAGSNGLLLDKAFDKVQKGLGVRFNMDRAIVAIGAPAEALARPLEERLDCELIVPENADVANALGAIGSEVAITEELLIRPEMTGIYLLYAPDERLEFRELEGATRKAAEIAREQARARAVAAGALHPEITVTRRDSIGSTAEGAGVFIERRVCALARGNLQAGG